MILMIDNYDSFVYNLVQYLGELGEEILVKRNNEVSLEEIEALNPDLIIIGGRQAEDIDSFKEIAPTVNLAVDGKDYMN